jgi:hypothetical protein
VVEIHMKEDLGLKMLEELGLITIDNNLMKCTPKYSNIYRKTSDVKEGETPESYCYRMSKEMFSDILPMWINKQSKKEKRNWEIYKQKVDEMNTLFNFILSINLTNMEKYLENLHHK